MAGGRFVDAGRVVELVQVAAGEGPGRSPRRRCWRLTDFDLVIVDDDAPEAELVALRALGVHLHVASANPDQQSLTWSSTATA